MKGFNPLASLIAEFRSFKTLVTDFIQEQREFNKEQRKLLVDLNTKVDLLVAEVSRYKNDSDELLVSVYAYCTQERIPFSSGELYKWGGLAARMSRRVGAKVVKTNDPRFGEVGLYERYILDNVVGEDYQ